MKEHQEKTKEELAQDISFQEWLDWFLKEPTSKELDDMQKDLKPTSINNINYQPLQGA